MSKDAWTQGLANIGLAYLISTPLVILFFVIF